MNKIKPLLKIQLLSWFGINKMIHSNDKKEKRKFIGFSILMIFVFINILFISFLYSYLMSDSFQQIGQINLLLGIMMMATCITMLFTTIYKTTGILFGFKDYDMIMSLPVKTSVIVISRLITLYILNMIFCLSIMLPAGIVYAIKVLPSFEFYFIFIVTIFFIPMVPIVISTFIGYIIAIVSSKFRKNNIVNLILNIIFFICIMFLSFSSSYTMQISEDTINNLGPQIMETINKIYPLTGIYVDALCNYNILSLSLFIIISISLFLIFSLFIGHKYKNINTSLNTVKTLSNYKIKSLKQSSPFSALYQKELKRYFSSPLYVLNTCFGMVLGIIMFVSIILFGAKNIEVLLEIPGFSDIIIKFSSIVISLFVVMSCTTCVSISLEGKNLWLLKSMPLKTKDIFMSKIAVNLTILLPCILIMILLFSLVSNTSIINLLTISIMPLSYAIFASLFGLWINLLFPNLLWESEATVIKRSISIIVYNIVSIVSIGIPIALLFMTSIDPNIIIYTTILTIVILSIIIYRLIFTKGNDIFYKL